MSTRTGGGGLLSRKLTGVDSGREGVENWQNVRISFMDDSLVEIVHTPLNLSRKSDTFF